MLRRVLMALMIAASAACGQVGPLHLPADAPDNEGYLLQRKKAAPPPAPVAAPAPAPVVAPPAVLPPNQQ
jgi:predicted small lipoprotein YifL